MKYNGKAIEIIGSKTVFGKETLWVRALEDGSIRQIFRQDIDVEEERSEVSELANIRYIAIASRIKEEIAQKRLLAPYESSLIPLPHQILVLEKVMQAPQTRFLLADEVGMGKTIEAGLVLKEMKLRGEVKRTLLLVPKSAMLQWQREMKEHFKENFYIYDAEAITTLAKTFASFDAEEELNFWMQHNQIIVSLDSLKPVDRRQGWTKEQVEEHNKYRLEAVVNADFDMVIIDEAHRMGGSTAMVTRYQLADTLCNAVPNVLLLSATPHRGKSDHFRRVLQLIDSDAFTGDEMPTVKEIEPYVIRSEKRYAVDYDGKNLFNERQTVKEQLVLQEDLHGHQMNLYKHVTDYVRLYFGKAKRGGSTAVALVMVMFQKLASSSTAAILSAMQTRLWRLQNSVDEDDLSEYDIEDSMDESLEDIDVNGEYGDVVNDDRTEEEILELLIEEAKECLEAEMDVKASYVLDKIRELQKQEGDADLKVLIFTEFRATQQYLTRILEDAGLSCASINGSMDLDKRNLELQKFRNEVNVMVATDAAGESLNMQFCHIVINYDLPWNPMALEQRIGRVDRIGQKHRVTAFNLLTNNSIDARVYEIIVEKLDVILAQLGIDKTSDVLDSTMDINRVNHLYLQSLLNPSRFEFAGEQWLYEIKKKLNDYKATEGILPVLKKDEIDNKAASDVKYSPLPQWLEEMVDLYVSGCYGKIEKEALGATKYAVKGEHRICVFDAEKVVDNPQAEHLTLQSEWIKKMLNEIDCNEQKRIPKLKHKELGTGGYFSLWKVSANNSRESKVEYSAQFVADNGSLYGAYANDIWNQLVLHGDEFEMEGEMNAEGVDFHQEQVMENLHGIFHKMECAIGESLEIKRQNKLRALEYMRHRIEKIGIANIRNSKLKRLDEELQEWDVKFAQESSIVPDVKHIITVRIDG